MDPLAALQAIGTAGALGLLIGLERQRAPSIIGGIRTFPLIAVFGALCGLLAARFGLWLPAIGMAAVGAVLLIGNLAPRQENDSPGITTEIAEAGPFYYAEPYHQQYLAKNPGGYCGLGGTGVSCPVGVVTTP